MKTLPLISALLAALFMAGGTALAQDAKQPQKEQAKKPAPEPIYGSQLMTRKERQEFHAKMRAAKTPEEREKIRQEHHEQMQQRAKERGVTLPDEPPAGGGMMRRRGGMGPGGGGMGPGGGGMMNRQ